MDNELFVGDSDFTNTNSVPESHPANPPVFDNSSHSKFQNLQKAVLISAKDGNDKQKGRVQPGLLATDPENVSCYPFAFSVR
ncbi:MAG TPA: hypothetical protein VGA55_04765 [Bacteroidota bacterium]